MNSKTVIHQSYEVAPQAATAIDQAQPSGLFSLLKQVVHRLVRYLGEGHEPQVWQTHNQHGDLWWNVYDPQTGRSLVCSTEEDVRIWLDQRWNS